MNLFNIINIYYSIHVSPSLPLVSDSIGGITYQKWGHSFVLTEFLNVGIDHLINY